MTFYIPDWILITIGAIAAFAVISLVAFYAYMGYLMMKSCRGNK